MRCGSDHKIWMASWFLIGFFSAIVTGVWLTIFLVLFHVLIL